MTLLENVIAETERVIRGIPDLMVEGVKNINNTLSFNFTRKNAIIEEAYKLVYKDKPKLLFLIIIGLFIIIAAIYYVLQYIRQIMAEDKEEEAAKRLTRIAKSVIQRARNLANGSHNTVNALPKRKVHFE